MLLRVFNDAMGKQFDAKENHGSTMKNKYFRCRNNNDIVPCVPGIPYTHVGTEIYLNRL